MPKQPRIQWIRVRFLRCNHTSSNGPKCTSGVGECPTCHVKGPYEQVKPEPVLETVSKTEEVDSDHV